MSVTSIVFMAKLMSPVSALAFIFGLCLGSFANVCILRIPEKTFFSHQRSVCPHCQSLIPWYLNIPLVSFFLLRGRAQCCQKPISWQYPLIELCFGLMTIFIYWNYPFLAHDLKTWDISATSCLRFFHAYVFFFLMMICAVIDLRLMIIPDVISLPMIAVAPIVAALHPELTVLHSTLGILLGAGLLYGVAWLYFLFRRESGMGFGDVKLLGAIGGWLGFQSILPTLLIGSCLGSLIGLALMIARREFTLKTALPFGPFLAAGALVELFFGQNLRLWLISPP